MHKHGLQELAGVAVVQLSDFFEINKFAETADVIDLALHQQPITSAQRDIGQVRQAVTIATMDADNCDIKMCPERCATNELRNQR